MSKKKKGFRGGVVVPVLLPVIVLGDYVTARQEFVYGDQRYVALITGVVSLQEGKLTVVPLFRDCQLDYEVIASVRRGLTLLRDFAWWLAHWVDSKVEFDTAWCYVVDRGVAIVWAGF